MTTVGGQPDEHLRDGLRPGVWGVLTTPFRGPDAEVDLGSAARQAHAYREWGVDGLTVLGVFGESAQLSNAERRQVLEVVADARGDLPLVVGVNALATAPALEEIENVGELVRRTGAAVMVQVNSADPQVLAAHLRRLHAATGVSMVVQDYPAASGVRIATRELAAVVADTAGVVAVKSESSPSPPAVATLTATVRVPVFGGLGGTCLLDELAVGAAGAMTGFSVPQGLLACVRAYARGGYPAAREAWLAYLPLVNFEFQPGIALRLRKESLRLRGVIDEAVVRAPAPPVGEAVLDVLHRHLAATPYGGPGRPVASS